MGWGAWEVTANGHGVSFGGNKNILELMLMGELHQYTKKPKVNYLNKPVSQKLNFLVVFFKLHPAH
jgi:hypothetical protein